MKMKIVDKMKAVSEVITFSGNNRGMGKGKIAVLIGALIFIIMLGALAPSFFSNLTTTSAPSWYNTLMPVIVAGGLVMAVWKVFN